MPSGGNHPPRHPAPVSGPGALSQRTDGQPVRVAPGGDYGDRQDLQRLQQAAPLATGTPPATSGGAPGLDLSQIVGLGEPSTSPDTPVTAGAAIGPGPGSEALGLPTSDKQAEGRALGKYLPIMVRIADSDDASPVFRQYVRELIANI